MRVFGVCGWKNSGKTTLVEKLLRILTARGLRVSTIKHAHHAFDIDHEGRDSHRHRMAGAQEVLIASHARWAHMAELRGAEPPTLEALLGKLAPCDLVLIEGYKRESHAKLEAHRAANGKPPMALEDESIRAVASDSAPEAPVPVLPLDDAEAIADFILRETGLDRKPASALPEGVDWTPVDDALARLRGSVSVAVGRETVALMAAEGRILARAETARRAHPPAANAAVDGYAFAHASLKASRLALVPGRSAAGAGYPHAVPAGCALRILTGAPVPRGADTVALQEHAEIDGGSVRFSKPPKPGENIRAAGENLAQGDPAAPAGRRLTAADLAQLACAGIGDVTVFQRLRVGLLSTGDELAEPGSAPGEDTIFDANRPMLAALLARWGFETVDLGAVPDDASALRAALDRGAREAQAILVSGGASAGDADHVSRLLREEGALEVWRVAMKPGRPLALARWGGVPVFGLPGNPVAAFVCALLFARPALDALAGADWTEPQPLLLQAGFSKRKKPGRREYPRARIDGDGRVQLFENEGSGLVRGLVWADGLVDLPDSEADIAPGDRVRFLPWSAFGL